MGMFKNRIAVPLIDAFGDAVMSSNIGKQIYKHIDDRIGNTTKMLGNQIQDMSNSIGKQIADTGAEAGLNTSAAMLTSGMLGGTGAVLGGGLSGIVSSALGPVVSNTLYGDSGINFNGLPVDMQEKLKILVKRAGI